MNLYQAYGLKIRSGIGPLALPAATGAPDVDVRLGDTPVTLPNPTSTGVHWEVCDRQVLIRLGRLGRFLIEDGRTITVTPTAESTSADLEFGLMNGALGPVLHQRGALVLHAAGVLIDGAAIVLSGASGVGKSTLLMALLQQGAQMITDDIAAVDICESGAQARVSGGVPFINTWRNTAEHFGYAVGALPPIRPELEKYRVRAPATGWAQPFPLRGIVILETHNDTGVRTRHLTGREAFAAIHSQTRGLRLAEAIQRTTHFTLATKVAGLVPVHRISRPEHNWASLDTVVSVVSDLARP